VEDKRRKEGHHSNGEQKYSNSDLFMMLFFPFSIIYFVVETIYLSFKKTEQEDSSQELVGERRNLKVKEGLYQPGVRVFEPPNTPPIQVRAESSRWSLEEHWAEEGTSPHYARIRNIILALFAIGFTTAIFPPAVVLAIPYFMYAFYSFASAIEGLGGTQFKRGFLIPIILTLPAAVSFLRYQAFYDGCIGLGGWECSNYDSSGPSFNSLLLALPLGSFFALLLPMSELNRGSLLVGMFYGFIMSVFVFFTFLVGGVFLWAVFAMG
jgi:hypothetical protein